MAGLKEFSVYNNLLTRSQALENPLLDLLPSSHERGWHVSRNLKKPLNHLDFLADKERAAAALNLHNVLTPRHLFNPNYELLERHQARAITTAEVIARLTAQLRGQGGAQSTDEVRQMLREYATIRHMEFHPTDVCNLTCRGCTYGHDDPAWKPPPINFPFREIEKISQLQPRSMVIIGGGEPGLYKDKETGQGFQEMVEQVTATNPGIHLALVTNGTYKPAGDWPHRFDWIRVSLDAASAETYCGFRGKPFFDRVIANYLRYLDYDVGYVGISFLFARSNIHEYAEVARFIYELVKKEKPAALAKVNIQYRPLRHDPYRYDRPFTEATDDHQIERAVQKVRKLADSSPAMRAFLRDQTNVTAVLGGNTHPPHEFARCYYSQAFKIVRANGDLRPCFIRVVEPDFVLGNITRDSLEAIALNTLYVAAKQKPHCDAHGCRQCHVNYTFEQGLNSNLEPSASPEVLADLMF